ncbi:hypothetical protein [Lentimicrobium sp. S6]|uniref:hypothetical protein n=1 Tax=Lentimicrobium sp. S6 TaxID=2735872 RepID=UPI0015582947|nr:hypothetical protein [Lentimicrobium sp. S6]NPD48170.1 hypothetical protein [Lentimicrobium sp. S6]
MKTKHLLIFLVFLTLAGCTEKKSIVGTWIEKDNFVSPRIWDITQDSFRIRYWNHYNSFYKIKGDTFMFPGFEGLKKNRFEIINDELNFYSIDNDSLIISLEKDSYNNFIDYFNKKKNTNISLPYLKSSINNFHTLHSMTFVFNKTDLNNVYVNGEKIVLDSLAFLKILEIKNRDISTTGRRGSLYCDREIKLKDINRLKKELQKARIIQISYLTQDSSDILYGNYYKLPYIENKLFDSVFQRHTVPPLPKIPPLDDFTSNDILCKIGNQSIEVNGDDLSQKELEDFLINKIHDGIRNILYINFDERFTYANYLRKLYEIKNIYISEQQKYALKKFNKQDIEKLEPDEYLEIRKRFPILVVEINSNEYKEMKKNAL